MAKKAGTTGGCRSRGAPARQTAAGRVAGLVRGRTAADAKVASAADGSGEGLTQALRPDGTVLRRAPRPSGCTRFVRREIADALPGICAMLLSNTMEGDLASLRLLLQMAVSTQGAEQGQGRRGDGMRPNRFAQKILLGFKDWEARETAKRLKS